MHVHYGDFAEFLLRPRSHPRRYYNRSRNCGILLSVGLSLVGCASFEAAPPGFDPLSWCMIHKDKSGISPEDLVCQCKRDITRQPLIGCEAREKEEIDRHANPSLDQSLLRELENLNEQISRLQEE